MPLNVRQRQPVAAFWYSALLPLIFSLFVILLGVFFAAAVFPDVDASIVSTIAAFAFIVSGVMLVYPLLYYLLFTYEIREQNITVNSGILFRQYETIDFKKIQTMDNERGPILMLFGLTIVEIWTASWDQLAPSPGKKGAQIRPRPDMRLILHKDDASKLRDFVMRSK